MTVPIISAGAFGTILGASGELAASAETNLDLASKPYSLSLRYSVVLPIPSIRAARILSFPASRMAVNIARLSMTSNSRVSPPFWITAPIVSAGAFGTILGASGELTMSAETNANRSLDPQRGQERRCLSVLTEQSGTTSAFPSCDALDDPPRHTYFTCINSFKRLPLEPWNRCRIL